MATFFFNRFQNFCCSTLARKNYFLQYTFFNQILFPEAFPEFLSDTGSASLRKNYMNLDIHTDSVITFMKNCRENLYTKFHLSNIGDWLSKNDFSALLHLILKKSCSNARISSRYIHYLHPIPEDLQNLIIPDVQLGKELNETDRYPFYTIVPFIIKKPENIGV